jgi:hypothetical protein
MGGPTSTNTAGQLALPWPSDDGRPFAWLLDDDGDDAAPPDPNVTLEDPIIITDDDIPF